MKPFDCMPAVRTPEAFQDTCRLRILDFCLPLRATGSATSTTFDFGAIFPFTFVPAYKSPCLRFAVTVTGHHARLGTRPLARLCRGGHPRPLNFMRFPRRNAHRTVREPLDSHGSRCSAIGTHVQWRCLVSGLLLLPVGPELRLNNAAPSVQSHYRTFNPTTGCSAPVLRIGTLTLVDLAPWLSPFPSQRQVLTVHTKA